MEKKRLPGHRGNNSVQFQIGRFREGGVGVCEEGEKKNFSFSAHVWKREGNFSQLKTKIHYSLYMNKLGASFTFYRDGCNQVAYLKTACVLTDYTMYCDRQLECKLL